MWNCLFTIFLLSKYLPLVWASIMALYMPSPNSFSPITWNSYLVRGVKLWILTFLASGGLIGNSSQFLDFGSDSRYLKRDWNCKMKPMFWYICFSWEFWSEFLKEFWWWSYKQLTLPYDWKEYFPNPLKSTLLHPRI